MSRGQIYSCCRTLALRMHHTRTTVVVSFMGDYCDHAQEAWPASFSYNPPDRHNQYAAAGVWYDETGGSKQDSTCQMRCFCINMDV